MIGHCRSTQSRINIESDGTLARAPSPCLDWVQKGAPQFIFWGPYLFKYYKTEYKVLKNMGITLKKNLLGAPNFFLARAPKFLNPALGQPDSK